MKIEQFHSTLLENGFILECGHEHFANYTFSNAIRLRLELDNKGFLYAYAFKTIMVPNGMSLNIDTERFLLSDPQFDVKHLIMRCRYLESFSFILCRGEAIWKS